MMAYPKRLVDHLPEQATFDDAMYAIYVRQKLERSLQAVEEGKVTSQEEMEKKYARSRVSKPKAGRQ